jgi:hypothetical protein
MPRCIDYILNHGLRKNKGELMAIDLQAKAEELLTKLGNSLYDREHPNPVCFNITEIQLVAGWLQDFLTEAETALE